VSGFGDRYRGQGSFDEALEAEKRRAGSETRRAYEQDQRWAREHLPDLPEVYVIGSLETLRAHGEDTSAEMVRERVEARMRSLG
jgi:hypothetical protein